ncbi:MAG: hypothetical protein ABJA67_15755, partial [Chthonomonadales bacterium]
KWLVLQALEHHWQRADVLAKVTASDEVEITATNVKAMTIAPPVGVDGAPINIAIFINRPRTAKTDPTIIYKNYHPGRPIALLLTKDGWKIQPLTGMHKSPGLQGPIDDALFSPIIAVRGTGAVINSASDTWLKSELDRFRTSWGIYFRGTLPEKQDTDITDEDIKTKNLYLFGDPSSNKILARIAGELPIKWTKDKISIGDKSYSTTDHLPMFIFPNPLNSEKYVVINTGMTFSTKDMMGSNALQYPHLPDYAIIKFDANHFTDDRKTDVQLAGFFDEEWKLPKVVTAK